MPYSGYSLNIYAKNVLGEYNPDLPLTLTANTKPANKAGPPRNLKVVEINEGSQHQASWLPPYPPTGLGNKLHDVFNFFSIMLEERQELKDH